MKWLPSCFNCGHDYKYHSVGSALCGACGGDHGCEYRYPPPRCTRCQQSIFAAKAEDPERLFDFYHQACWAATLRDRGAPRCVHCLERIGGRVYGRPLTLHRRCLAARDRERDRGKEIA